LLTITSVLIAGLAITETGFSESGNETAFAGAGRIHGSSFHAR
jgi:hypothetical protein